LAERVLAIAKGPVFLGLLGLTLLLVVGGFLGNAIIKHKHEAALNAEHPIPPAPGNQPTVGAYTLPPAPTTPPPPTPGAKVFNPGEGTGETPQTDAPPTDKTS
jgi:hypothetical protein